MANISDFDKSELEMLFSKKQTENGDDAYTTVSNTLLDILFMTEYYTNHLEDVPVLGNSDLERLFAMMVRDPRYGLGRRDLGRVLMKDTGCSYDEVLKCGRADDLWNMFTYDADEFKDMAAYFKGLIDGNHPYREIIKKWMPRYSSKNLPTARAFAKLWGMNKQEYGHYIKTDTVENMMSRQRFRDIEFDKVPSLASVKYAKAFAKHEPERYGQYIEDVRAGRKKLNISTTNVYDVYRNRDNIDADLFFGQLEKIKLSCLPIVDVSGSMFDRNDSIGKALSIGHYLARCSTYAFDTFVTFSVRPQLVRLDTSLAYVQQLGAIESSDWACNTDLGAVMRLLQGLKSDFPDWIVVLSDMEFDKGSNQDMDALHEYMRSIGANTKILWWNFNNRSTTVPTQDKYGNLFFSGYNPKLLKFLKAGFNAEVFLSALLEEYGKAIMEK